MSLNAVKSFAISGFCNYLGPVKQSERGTPFRNLLIATGKDKPTYSVTLLNEHCRLADFEITKGCKIRLKKVRLQPDTKTKNFQEHKILNTFSVIAEDWEVVDDFTGKPAEDVLVSNGNSFHGFVNHVKNGRTVNDTESLSLLVCNGNGNPTVSYTTYGKNIDKIDVKKGAYIYASKLSLNPVFDDNFKEKNIATKFYVSLIGCEERVRHHNYQESAPNDRSERSAPPVDDYAGEGEPISKNREDAYRMLDEVERDIAENGYFPKDETPVNHVSEQRELEDDDIPF